jgi:hypothetical protein
LLDANGWAVNAFARVNVPFGDALTSVAALPLGTIRPLKDPFADKRRPWGFYAVAFAVIALAVTWISGKADDYLPDEAKSSAILHRSPPVTPTPAK